MLKNFFLLLLAIMGTRVLFSQKIMHSVGTTASVLFGELKTANPKYNFVVPYGTITYFPRYNFVELINSSFSIGMPIGLGANVLTNVSDNKVALSIACDVAVAVDCNIGCRSYYDNDEGFGGYFGTGFSYAYVGGTNVPGYTDYKGPSYGPLLRGGLRFLLFRNRGGYGLGVTTGLFYKKGLDENKLSTAGAVLMLDF